MTYGYFPTKWRRWPTAHLAMTPATPEEVPTPAKDLDDTEPADSDEPAPTFDSDLPPALPDDLPAPGESEIPSEAPITAPPFGDMPSPQGAAEPPFGDLPALPSDQGASSPAAPTTQPPTDLFQAPESGPTPAMPQDDPFRDDPEPAPGPGGSSSGSSTSTSAEVTSRPALIPALESLPPEHYAAPVATSAAETSPVATSPVAMRPNDVHVAETGAQAARREQGYQPRLLSPVDEVDAHVPLPPERSPSVNPMRPAGTPATMIRQTSLAPVAAPPTSGTAALEQRVGQRWRVNPLRVK